MIPANELWELFKDDKWATEVLLKLDEGPLQVLFDTLNSAQRGGGDAFVCNLPHLFAFACEKATDNGKRQQALFLFTLLSSIGGGTVSAIDRLLRGNLKNSFRNDIKSWREQLGNVMLITPAVVAARIRPVMASLYLT